MSSTNEPMTTTSLTMIGSRVPVEVGEGAQQPLAQVDLAGLAERRHRARRCGRRATPASGPGLRRTRRSPPSVQYATPRVWRTRTPSLGPVFQTNFAGGRLEGRDGAQPGAEVEQAAGHEGCRLRADGAAGGLAVADGVGNHRLPPRDLEVDHRLRVDLVEGQVLGAGLVGRVGRPLRPSGRPRGEPPRRGPPFPPGIAAPAPQPAIRPLRHRCPPGIGASLPHLRRRQPVAGSAAWRRVRKAPTDRRVRRRAGGCPRAESALARTRAYWASCNRGLQVVRLSNTATRGALPVECGGRLPPRRRSPLGGSPGALASRESPGCPPR